MTLRGYFRARRLTLEAGLASAKMGFGQGFVERMQLSRESAMVAYESSIRKKHIMAEHQREALRQPLKRDASPESHRYRDGFGDRSSNMVCR